MRFETSQWQLNQDNSIGKDQGSNLGLDFSGIYYYAVLIIVTMVKKLKVKSYFCKIAKFYRILHKL